MILRPSTVHGPSENFRSDIVLNNLSAAAFTKNKIIINTNGKPYRPVLYIDDLCKVIISSFLNQKKQMQKIFNVGYPKKLYYFCKLEKWLKKFLKMHHCVLK